MAIHLSSIEIGDDGMTRTVPVRYYRCQYCGEVIKMAEDQIMLHFIGSGYPFDAVVHTRCVKGYLERRAKQCHS